MAKNHIRIEKNGNLIEDPLQLAHEFNKFFKEKIEKLAAGIRKDPKIDPLAPLRKKLEGTKRTFKLKTVSAKHVLNILNQLKSKESYGDDGITSEILKIGSEVLYLPLTYIINTSIKTGKYQEKWKVAKVIPIHKKNDRNSMKNYRLFKGYQQL